jgi:hypothetical protein
MQKRCGIRLAICLRVVGRAALRLLWTFRGPRPTVVLHEYLTLGTSGYDHFLVLPGRNLRNSVYSIASRFSKWNLIIHEYSRIIANTYYMN